METPYSDDPWVHRSDHMRCRTCMWFIIKQPPDAAARDRATLGRCRRHSPALAGFPAVFEEDWCGDHKLDEGKI
jgi:hypothetical protein